MDNAYIKKLVEIGEKEYCSGEDARFFRRDMPDIGNRKFIDYIRKEYGGYFIFFRDGGPVSFILNDDANKKPDNYQYDLKKLESIIKGVHIIENSTGGLGSSVTSVRYLLETLGSLNRDKYIDAYNWVAAHGGNYFIGNGINFEKARRYAEIHNEAIAVAKKKIDDERKAIKERRRKISIEHIKRTKQKNENRSIEINTTQKLTKLNQSKRIATSEFPLDIYPEVFVKCVCKNVDKLDKEELISLKEKLKRIHTNSNWKIVSKILRDGES